MHSTNNKLALGTVQFGLAYGIANSGGAVSQDDADLILKEAQQIGIDTLDTAVGYGESEAVLGRLGVSPFRIVTKLPALPAGCREVDAWVREQVQGSIQRLGVDRLYAVLLHRPSQLLEADGKVLYQALVRLKADATVKKIGISVYGPEELDLLMPRFALDLVQAPLSILDQRLLTSGWAALLAQRGVELHARSCFLQGLLLMPAAQRPSKFARFPAVWQEWDRWLDQIDLTPLQACLRYVMAQAVVDRVVCGVASQTQLREIAAAAQGSLSSLPSWPPQLDPDLLNPSQWNAL